MKIKVKISLGLILILLIIPYDKVVKSDPLEEQLRQHNESIEENSIKLQEYEKQENELQLAIQELDSKIEAALYEQNSLEEEINNINSLIHNSNLKIEKYTKEIEDKEAKKNVFIRNMYKFGELSYADVVFKSDNVFDAVYNFYNYSSLIISSKENIKKLDTLKKDLITEQQSLEMNKSKLEQATIEAKAVVNELTTMMDDQKEKLNKLNSVKTNLAYKIDTEKSEISNILSILEEERIQAEYQKQRQEEARNKTELSTNEQTQSSSGNYENTNTNDNTNTNENTNDNINRSSIETVAETPNTTASQVVTYASQFQGVPYVWGGTTPNGFDCSGLVQYCYAQFGYYLPRVSQDQQYYGTDVSLSELRTGDLVFWGRPATHVAFYIDGGYILHAPYTGEVVKIQSINLNNITSAKRIIN